MIVLDTSVLYALADAADPGHGAAIDWARGTRARRVTTPLVLAELDLLVLSRLGDAAAARIRHDITAGAYDVTWWDGAEKDIAAVAGRYAEARLGLADASLMALAARSGTTRIATFDERHFRAVRPLAGGDAFTLLPLDG